MIDVIKSSLTEAHEALTHLLANTKTQQDIAKAAQIMIETFARRSKVYSCGNGGSMCDAMHLAEELTGRYRLNRAALPAMAISDPSHLACVANDFGYEAVFSRFIEAHGNRGDCLVGISTSGTSKNVLAAAEVAKAQGLRIVALTGKHDTPLEALADVTICTPGGRFADRVQEQHIKVIHILIELCERHFFPQLYA